MAVNGIFKPDNKLPEDRFVHANFTKIAEWIFVDIELQQYQAISSGSGTEGFKKSGISVEGHIFDVLKVNSLLLFRNIDLCKFFECFNYIHSLTLPEHPERGV